MSKKALFVHFYGDEKGGAPDSLYELVLFLKKYFKIDLLFFSGGYLLKKFSQKGFKVYKIDTGRLREFWRFIKTVFKIRKIVKSNDYDFIFSNGLKPYIYVYFALIGFSKIKKFYILRGLSENLSFTDSFLLSLGASLVFSNSKYTKKNLSKKKNFRKCFVIYPGASLYEMKMIKKETDCKKFLRNVLNLKELERKKIILLPSVIRPSKRQDFVLKLFPYIKRKIPEAMLVLAGDIGFDRYKFYKNYLLEIVKNFDNDVKKDIIFTGWLEKEDLKKLIVCSDLIVLPAIKEPFGRIALRACLSGKPVLLSKEGGHIEIGKNFPNAHFFDTNTPEIFVKKAVNILKNKDTFKGIEITFNPFETSESHIKLLRLVFHKIL